MGAMDDDLLPDEHQRKLLCEVIGAAFVELRSISDEPEQVHELAYAFHNLPLTMYGWGTWSWSGLRAVLVRYRRRFPDGGPDYATMLDAIHPGA